jgi:hypothetical protein
VGPDRFCRIKDETSYEANDSGDQPGEVRLPVPMLIGSSSDQVFIKKTDKRVEMQKRTAVPTLQGGAGGTWAHHSLRQFTKA